MHPSRDKLNSGNQPHQQSVIWRRAINSVFGAAKRLHQYRDARDVLLRHVIHEQEVRLRQQECCDKRCR